MNNLTLMVRINTNEVNNKNNNKGTLDGAECC